MSRETLPKRISDFLDSIKEQKSLHQHQKDEALLLYKELKNLSYYCTSCTKVLDEAMKSLREWDAIYKNKNSNNELE